MNRIVSCVWLLIYLQACAPNDDSKPVAAKVQPSGAGATTNVASKSSAEGAPGNTPIPKDFTEKLFQNPFDTDAVYFLSQRSGTPKALTVLVKRDSRDGTQYSRWQFNCVDQTAQNLGVAANIQDLNKSGNSMPTKPTRYELQTRLGAIATSVCP